jgi:hypothetical protein
MNREDTKRLAIIENARPEILAESIPRNVYVSDTKFLIRLIRDLEQQVEDAWADPEDR